MRLILCAVAAAVALLVGGVSESQAQGRWVPCANENGVCEVPYPTTVRYGARGRYAERQVRGTVRCNNSVFGDPMYGVGKQCSYLVISGGGRPEPAGGWEACANENGFCSFRGRAVVRYGARGRYVFRRANDGIACNNRVFGDPIEGVTKRCEIQR